MSTFRVSLVLALYTIAFFSSGARAADDTTVEGTVTLNGEPLPTGARIFFHFGDGQFVGTKVTDGKFKMKAVPAGTYKVTVEMLKEGKQALPARYSIEDKSELRVEVRKGANELNLELTSK
jgi:hypothetical protein